MLFSIVTICYNDLSGLKLTFDSIQKQSFNDFEWIVVDGRSSDDTANWLKSITDPRLQWVSEKDSGLFDAMNKGQKMASGKYIIFLNSYDEFASENILLEISSQIKQNKEELKLIYGDSIDREENGKEHYKNARNHKTYRRGMFTQHQAMFFLNDKSVYYNLNYKITADYAYIGEFMQKISESSILYIKKPICIFKLGGTNETKRFKALIEDYHIRKNIFKMSFLSGITLLGMHFLHTILKRISPNIIKRTRYNKNTN